MKLKPGCKAEYIRRLASIWPALKDLLKEAGISDYFIFLDEDTNSIFAVQQQQAGRSSQQLGTSIIVITRSGDTIIQIVAGSKAEDSDAPHFNKM